MDWNEDGRFDLVVGDSDGVVRIYLNEGSEKAPKFAAPVTLLVAGEPFKWENGGRIKPEVVDWNNDGKKDLLLGEERGAVLLLLNTGSNTEPAFDGSTRLKDGDRDLKVWMRGDPCVADWNGDGKKDLLVADEGGSVLYFENRGTDGKPAFEGAVRLEAKGWPMSPGTSGYFRADLNGDEVPELVMANHRGEVTIRIKREDRPQGYEETIFVSEHGRPNLREVDWNEDGRTDVLIAESSGAVRIVINASEETVKFEAARVLLAGGEPLAGGPGAALQVEDLDGDGKKDLVSIDLDGNALCFMNTGTSSAPILGKGEKREKASSPICGGYRARLDVADWNGDGRLDLVYGVTSFKGSRSRVYVFLRPE